jgi:hypothetical protein
MDNIVARENQEGDQEENVHLVELDHLVEHFIQKELGYRKSSSPG